MVFMMSKTAPALERIDALLPALARLPDTPDRRQVIEQTDALRRAVAAFHMEAIRFRMFSVDRLLKQAGDENALKLFDEVRHALESAGFHTRSHAAPGT
jgi:hypothetical protein